MKNWEKYKETLMHTGTMFGVEDDSGEPYYCDDINCGACIFDKDNLWHDKRLCGYSRMDWLYSDYEEPKPKLTKEERVFLDAITYPDYLIRREEEGHLFLSGYGFNILLKPEMFSFINYEKVWRIKELKELEVEE